MRTPIAIGVILMLVILLSALLYYRQQPAVPVSAPAENASPEPSAPPSLPPPAPPKADEPSARTTPSPAAPRTPAKREPSVTPSPRAGAETRATLTVESDVPGASVFVDREFVGTAPLTLSDLEPGSKRINLVADGFDGVSRTLDLTGGAHTVTLRFKEVRLDKRIAVTHKHGMGSCTGELVATVDGVRYETSNTKDAGTVPFSALEQFQVNYLEKNLRVKQRGGRTWNFTDDNPNADALFVFHRDVEAARKKLAQGYAPIR